MSRARDQALCRIHATFFLLDLKVAERNAGSKLSLPLEKYAGTYRNAWYGDVNVKHDNGKFVMSFSRSPALTGELEHFQYDTFVAWWKERAMDADAFVTFSLTPEGAIDEIKIKAVSPATDFSYDFHDLLLKPIR